MRPMEMRAELCAKLLRKGESYFPYTNPGYPHRFPDPERLERIEDSLPAPPVNPLAPNIAGDGLAVWDVAAAPVEYDEFREMSPVKVPAFREINSSWINQTTRSFYEVGMVKDGAVVRRPKCGAIVDLVSVPWGWKLLEAAHALAHRSEVKYRFRPGGYGLYGGLMLNWVARLAVAVTYGLPVDVTGETCDDPLQSNDGLQRYGIVVCDSNSFHSPILRVPCIGRRAPVPDRDVAFVAAGVYVEPHPKGFTNGTSGWLEVNRWSCSPTMVSISGWECIDTISRQWPTCAFPGSNPEYVIAAPALMPYETMWSYIECAKQTRGEAVADNARYWNVLDWLDSEQFKRTLAVSPPLPCRECLRLNMRAEGVPGRPQCQQPKEKPDRNDRNLSYEDRMWLEWDDKIDKVFDIIESAVVFHEIRLYGASKARSLRRCRKAEYRKRIAAIKKMDSLEKRAVSAYRKGNQSLAQSLMNEKQLLQDSLKDGIIQGNEKQHEEHEETQDQAEEAGACGEDTPQADAPVDGKGG